MTTLDPRIEKIRLEYGLERTDFWELPQKKGTWLVKHSALETVAAKAGITFDLPEIIEARTADKIAVIVTRGFRGDRSEWSFGEASPLNNKTSYPFAMAEKRDSSTPTWTTSMRSRASHPQSLNAHHLGTSSPRNWPR
jgi:hypothetical protein